jgi:hypothetical protein
MLRKRSLVWLFILIVVVFVGPSSWSQQPSPSKRKTGHPDQTQTQAAQQPPASDQRGTENSPFIVTIHPTQKAQAETDQETKDRLDKAAYDRNTLILSLLLVIVAFLQFAAIGIQAFFLWLAFKATKKSADIAESSLVKLNRPFIFPKGFHVLWHRNESIKDAEKYWWSINPIWENSGNTRTHDMTAYVNSYFDSEPYRKISSSRHSLALARYLFSLGQSLV